MKKIYLVVLYKTQYSDSQTLRVFSELCFGKNEKNFFVIWDNSPTSKATLSNLKVFLKTENVAYIHTPENTPLSKVYNFCLDTYSGFEVLVIFDQDTKVARADFDAYLEDVISENSDINIFLPKIYSKSKLYSPGKFWVFKGWHYKKLSIGMHKDRFYTAIMSGTCARIDFLKRHNIRFNENLALYGIDTCFFCDVRKIDSRFYVLDEKPEHSLSENGLNDFDKKVRSRQYISAYKKITRKNYFYLFLISLYEFFLRVIRRI